MLDAACDALALELTTRRALLAGGDTRLALVLDVDGAQRTVLCGPDGAVVLAGSLVPPGLLRVTVAASPDGLRALFGGDARGALADGGVRFEGEPRALAALRALFAGGGSPLAVRLGGAKPAGPRKD
jgi:hypothetical protein